MKTKVLIIDDEEDILEFLKYNLKKEGYIVYMASSAEEALQILKKNTIDVITLDLMLPEMDGLEFTKLLKNDENFLKIPIIIVSAKDEEVDIVTGLEVGADDYLAKPFSPRVLIARIKALLRRKKVDDKKSKINFCNFYIDIEKHLAFFNNELLKLTLTEFQILTFLIKKPGFVFSRFQIVDAVHGIGHFVTDRSVDVQIVGLRKKLGEAGKYIETVRGIGYRFKEAKFLL